MMSGKIPFTTILLSIATVAYSFHVNHSISGSLFGKVEVTQLEPFGGIVFEHIRHREFWRLLASQLIHVKQMHMLFNVLSFAWLGSILERYVGAVRFFILWFVSGSVGTLVSTLAVKPPWNLGTGASQAVMGVAAFGVWMLWKRVDLSGSLKLAVLFALVPAVGLDLIFYHGLKPGHIVGFAVGLGIGAHYLENRPGSLLESETPPSGKGSPM